MDKIEEFQWAFRSLNAFLKKKELDEDYRSKIKDAKKMDKIEKLQWTFRSLYTFLRKKELDEDYRSKIKDARDYFRNVLGELEIYINTDADIRKESRRDIRRAIEALGVNEMIVTRDEIRDYSQQLMDYLEQLRELDRNPGQFYEKEHKSLYEMCKKLSGLKFDD